MKPSPCALSAASLTTALSLAPLRPPQQQDGFSAVWVCPRRDDQDVGRLELSVRTPGGAKFFTNSYDSQVNTDDNIGWVSLFRDASLRLPVGKTEGTVGMTGDLGW